MADRILSVLDELRREEFEKFTFYLNEDVLEGCAPIPQGQLEGRSVTGVVRLMKSSYGNQVVKVTLEILKKVDRNDLFQRLEKYSENSLNSGAEQEGTQTEDLQQHLNKETNKAQQSLKTQLKKKCESIFEGLAKQGQATLLNEIYTELYITEGESVGVNNEHEVRLIEAASKSQTTQETAICCNDIFKSLHGKKEPRTVLTKGIAGIGKTVSVQKFILDWAEGTANQDVDFIFTLPFRDLNLKCKKMFSLMQLLKHYFPQMKGIQNIDDDKVKVLLIFDGLDECRLSLDFQGNEICCDITEVASVDVLLTNLIQGNLLPSALLWITSRPAAANQIPPECVDQVTEVQGFNDPQKEEYFRKRIRDQEKASRIISHIKSVRSLYIMCHIPVFCWISATVLDTMLGKVSDSKMPKTLTEMYTRFLLMQNNLKNKKYHGIKQSDSKKISVSDAKIILKLGRLAFLQLKKGHLIFYEEDLRESGIDVREASVYSGVCTEIFKEECGLDQEKVYCFVHLSIQEYLAALFVFHSCVNGNRNVLREEESRPHTDRVQLSELHRSAVDHTLNSPNGHLDLFLRFLLGLSLDSIQTLLGELLTRSQSRSPVIDPYTLTTSGTPVLDSLKQSRTRSVGAMQKRDFVTFFQKIKTWKGRRSPGSDQGTAVRSFSPDSQALTETRSESIDKTIWYIKMKIKVESSADRTINLFHCLNELNDNSLVEEIQNSQRLGNLSDKMLESDQCSALAFSLLRSEKILDEFDLKTYNTSAAGLQRLVPVVRNCQKAILNGCNLTTRSCEIVASALQSTNSPLRDLDLSNNDLGDSGVELLCAGLMSPNCKLQTLVLNYNNLRDSGMKELCVGLTSPNCALQRLDLSHNNVGDSGVKELVVGLMSPNCKLQRLGLSSCELTEKSCDIVASALQPTNSPLRDLDFSFNNLGDSGVELLCAGLMSPNCKLQTLGLGWCDLTEGCCDVLASVLRSPYSELRNLELRDNDLQDLGVRALSAGLEDPHCKLQRLGLSGCGVTQRGCDSLASALSSNPSHLRELDLRYNHPGDSGVRALSAAKPDTLTLLVDHGGENRTKPGPRKYGYELTLDPNTAHRELSLSEGNRKVTHTPGREEPYPDHPERFEYHRQVLCEESVCERCYWEAEWCVSGLMGRVSFAVTDKGINRKGGDTESRFGNKNSGSLECFEYRKSEQLSYFVRHNTHQMPTLNPFPLSRSAGQCDEDEDAEKTAHVYRVGVYVDRPARTLSFYSVSDCNALTLLHRFHARFIEHAPLCAGFRVYDSSVSLCQTE